MEMFGRKLTADHLKGFVEIYSVDGEITLPKEWVLELIDAYKFQEEIFVELEGASHNEKL